MKIDTGAAIFYHIRRDINYDTLFSQVLLNQATVGLCTYTGESILICGEFSVDVQYGTQTKKLSLIVVKGKGHN